MSDNTRMYPTEQEMWEAVHKMDKFQKIHNILRLDYIQLLRVTDNYKTSEADFNSLYRASLRSLLSLIEADLFGLNQLDPYDGYEDKDDFKTKFKNTFKELARVRKSKEPIVQKYLSSHYHKLQKLKEMRDELVHPKEFEHLHEGNISNLETLTKVFYDYDKFINELMDGFYVGVKLPA